jgi:hypothetical protein
MPLRFDNLLQARPPRASALPVERADQIETPASIAPRAIRIPMPACQNRLVRQADEA